MTNEAIEAVEITLSSDLIDNVLQSINENDNESLQVLFSNINAKETAHLLESIPDEMRSQLWQFIPDDRNGEVLVVLGKIARASLVSSLGTDQLVDAVSNLKTKDLAAVIDTLPNEPTEAIRQSLDDDGLLVLETALAFPESSAGRLLDTQSIAIRAHITLGTVLRFLRTHAAIPEYTVALMVVDRDNHFKGELSLSELLTRDPSCTVDEAMNHDAFFISPQMLQTELVNIFRDRNLVSVPVVSDDEILLGRIALDDMITAFKASEHQLLSSVGLDEDEDLFAPIVPSTKRRLFWLGINLGTAFLAAWVIGLFSGVLDRVVALAVLMPIVASMGGIAGGQTLTLMIRGLATGKISSTNARWLAYKEIAISAISGITWAVVVGIVSYIWFEDIRISLILAASMLVNLLVASISGFGIPVLMKRMGIDPALAGGVVLTTATDVVGFVSFLGLATLFLT